MHLLLKCEVCISVLFLERPHAIALSLESNTEQSYSLNLKIEQIFWQQCFWWSIQWLYSM